jgi:cytoskeletal protein CcmA (bactofilin family)
MSVIRKLNIEMIDGIDLLPLAQIKHSPEYFALEKGLPFTRRRDEMDYYDISVLGLEPAQPARDEMLSGSSPRPDFSARRFPDAGVRPPASLRFALRAYLGAPHGTVDLLLPAELRASAQLRSTVLEIAGSLGIAADHIKWAEILESSSGWPSGGPAAEPVPAARTGAADPAPSRSVPSRHDEQARSNERRTLVVGKGITVQGSFRNVERLVVEGVIEGTMIHAAELLVANGGTLKGEIAVEEAEIAGAIEGTLTAHGILTVRSTGLMRGTVRCRRLQVENGGQITGQIEMLHADIRSPAPDPAPSSAAPMEAAPTEAALTQAAPTQAAPTHAAPTEAVPTEVTPTQSDR